MSSKQCNGDDTVNITATVEEIKKELALLFSNVDLMESDIYFHLLGEPRLEYKALIRHCLYSGEETYTVVHVSIRADSKGKPKKRIHLNSEFEHWDDAMNFFAEIKLASFK